MEWYIYLVIGIIGIGLILYILNKIGNKSDDNFIGRTMNRINSGCSKIIKKIIKHDC